MSLVARFRRWRYERRIGVRFVYPANVADVAQAKLNKHLRRVFRENPGMPRWQIERMARLSAMRELAEYSVFRIGHARTCRDCAALIRKLEHAIKVADM